MSGVPNSAQSDNKGATECPNDPGNYNVAIGVSNHKCKIKSIYYGKECTLDNTKINLPCGTNAAGHQIAQCKVGGVKKEGEGFAAIVVREFSGKCDSTLLKVAGLLCPLQFETEAIPCVE